MLLKKLLFLGIASLAITTNSNSQEICLGQDAAKLYPNANVVRESNFSEVPSYVRFFYGAEEDIDGIHSWLKKYFKLSDAYDFKTIRVENDHLGYTHHRFQQTFEGKPIEGAVWILHAVGDKVVSMNGQLYNDISGDSPSINELTAFEYAKNHIGADVYKWEVAEEEEHLKLESGDPDASYFPVGELVYVSQGASMNSDDIRLAYRFNIYAHSELYRANIYVDAVTGEILFENMLIQHADTPGTAETAYSGMVDIVADSFGAIFRLRDNSRGLGIRTWDLNTGTDYGASVDFEDDDNEWVYTGSDLDEYAYDAHWGAEKTYDYFYLIHGRNSIDNSGYQLNSYVHYNTGYVNAFWDGTRMTYGDGNSTYSPLTSIDIAGHEITHGLTTFTANLTYYAESGALNESFSDIFGTAIENYARPSDWNWSIGEDIGSAFRSMSNPNTFNDPDTYFGDHWASLTGGDAGGVHTNSGVQNFWYYLLTEGGTGTNDNGDDYTVIGQGFEVASAVAFRNLTTYLTPSSQFNDARFYGILSAIDLYGACTPEVEATTNAWYAVGVGAEYTNEVIANFTADITEACSAPFTVEFTNLSVNATSYTWDFGDGASSIVASPTHEYMTIDTFTVQLIADGGLCGIDTLTLVDYIKVDTSLDCIITMPESGFGNIQTSCEGTLYDSGGDGGDYGGGEDAQITIEPFGAAAVTVDFLMFDVEAGPGSTCGYDYLEMYDGPNTSAPLVDTYCNNNLPPATYTSTGSAITFVFHSDGGVQDAGFEIVWTCVDPTSPPETDFSANVTASCTGVIEFNDESTNGPTSWSWDFGDGGTSTDQNPTHTYTADGTYTVTLTASNGIGSDDEIKVDYIVVDIPDAPIAADASICDGKTVDLTATGTGNIIWYETLGGTPVYVGTTFSTPLLSGTTNYYVSDIIPGASYNVGPSDNSFGGGGYFTGNQHLIFDCFEPVILRTVKVFAGSAGNRTIELRNNVGTILQTAIVYVDAGEQTVTLDFDIPVGTSLQLGTEDGSAPDLYRNNSGPSYPYTEAGIIEITESSAGTDYYYFFYDWEVEEYACESPATEVTVTVDPFSTETISGDDVICVQGGPVTFTTTAGSGTWLADCASCIDPITGEFDPAFAGVGTWTVNYDADGSCILIDPYTVEVSSCLGLNGYNGTILEVYPNPTNGSITIKTGLETGGVVRIVDLIGKEVFAMSFTATSITLEPALADGTYIVEVYSTSNVKVGQVKLIKN